MLKLGTDKARSSELCCICCFACTVNPSSTVAATKTLIKADKVNFTIASLLGLQHLLEPTVPWDCIAHTNRAIVRFAKIFC